MKADPTIDPHPEAEVPLVVPPGAQQVYALQPMAPSSGGESAQSSLRAHALLSALRRRWFVAISLGIILGASAAAAVWQSIPDEYTAFSEIILDPQNIFLYSNRDTREYQEPFNVYKQTNMRLATYPFVLTNAMREEAVAKCQTLSKQPDPEQWLAENLQVSSPASQFIQISLTGDRPNDLALIVNAVVKAFREEVIEKSRRDRLASLEDLQDRVRKEQAELDKQIAELRRRDQDLKVANKEQADLKYETLSGYSLELTRQLGQVKWEILQTEVELEQHRAMAKAIADLETDPPEAQTDEAVAAADVDLPIEIQPLWAEIEIPEDVIESHLVADPEYVEKMNALDHEEIQLRLNKKRFAPNHSRIVQSEARVDELTRAVDEYRRQHAPAVQEQLRAELRDQLTPPPSQLVPDGSRNRSEEEAATVAEQAPELDPIATAERTLELKRQLRDQIQKELEAFQVETKDLGSLWIDRELQNEEVEKLKAQVAELETVERKRRVELQYQEEHPPIDVKRQATAPTSPDQGKRVKLAGVTGFGLFGLIVAGVVFYEYSARRLSTVNEVRTDLNLQVMSTIPLMPRWLDDDDPSRSQKSAYWHSVLTESVDATRALLIRHAQTQSTKVVMIASAMGGEGKTTLSCHLSTSLARAGRSVLLIDGDLRRPTVHKVYDLEKHPGVCEILTGESDVEFLDAIHALEPAGLNVLTAGSVNAAVLRELAQDRLGQLLEIAREKYDFVIIDTSPILPVTDALLMSQHVDGVLFSIRRDVSRAAKVAASVQRLTMLGANVLGAVAIGLDDGPVTANYGYSYYGNGYGYGYGYGYGVNPHAINAISQPPARS